MHAALCPPFLFLWLLISASQVFKREELQVIADLCVKHDVICISDEVYEWLTYDGNKHVKIGEIINSADKKKKKVRLPFVASPSQSHWALMFLCCVSLVASLPGMWERTVTIGSGGKTFSATGWKVDHKYGM